MSLSVSMTAKRSALATLVQDTLDAHGFVQFKVETRMRQALLDGAGERDRDSLMGDPVAYARIAHVGEVPASTEHMTPFGAVSQVPHQFGVFVWFEYHDDDVEAHSSQAEWDALIESEDDSTPGLLTLLRETGQLQIGGTTAYVGTPQEVVVPDEPLHLGEQAFAHYLQFFITIT